MAREIKSIETHYKGYRFRSRLEARWAVFFDCINISYEYEPEGFVLPSGNYLPDFRLDGQTWLEIKPLNAPDPWQIPWYLKELAEATCDRCVLISGDPWRNEYGLIVLHDDYEFFDATHRKLYQFCECRDGCDGELLFSSFECCVGWGYIAGKCCDCDRWPCGEFEHAYKAARSARFEHGEHP